MIVTFEHETHTYKIGGAEAPSVTTILRETGAADVRFAPKAAMHRGSVVHEMVYLYESGLSLEGKIEDKYLGYSVAYQNFKIATGFISTNTEQILSHVNSSRKYCGTTDLIGLIDGRPVIIDIKTGGYASWHGLQLAAYKMADSLVLTDGSTISARTAIPYNTEPKNLYLKPDGSFTLLSGAKLGDRLVPYTDSAWDNAWKLQLKFYYSDRGK